MTVQSPMETDAGLTEGAAPRQRTLRASIAARLAAPLCRPLERLLGRVLCGAIQVVLPDGRTLTGRGASPGPHAALVLRRWRALVRLAAAGDVGLAESYRDGDWTTPDLLALLEFGLRNEAAWGGSLDAWPPVRGCLRALHAARANTRRGSRRNIAFHYDLGNDFYAQWLDPSLLYSSALYRDDAQSLEEAQACKLERVAELLRLSDLGAEAQVLEIGCGWGALAVHLAGRHAAAVAALTISERQLLHARRSVEAHGLAARVDFRLQDYRDVRGEFDRIVSIEMLEAVGEPYWPVFFATLRDRLRPGGRAVVQVITIDDAHFQSYRQGADFIQRFVFPGGMLPSPGALRAQAERAGLSMHTAERFGIGYASTLREWRRRFLAAWPAIARMGFDDAFRRLWEYYLCYCEAGFRSGRIDVGLYVFEHAGASASGREAKDGATGPD